MHPPACAAEVLFSIRPQEWMGECLHARLWKYHCNQQIQTRPRSQQGQMSEIALLLYFTLFMYRNPRPIFLQSAKFTICSFIFSVISQKQALE